MPVVMVMMMMIIVENHLSTDWNGETYFLVGDLMVIMI